MKLLFLLILPAVSFAQLTVKNGTTITGAAPVKLAIKGDVSLPPSSATADFSSWDFVLNGGAQKFAATGAITIAALEPASGTTGNKTISGTWTITNSLKLNKGNLNFSTVPGEEGKLIYAGANALNNSGGSSTSYINGPLTILSSGGELFFPVGNADGYFPIGLTNVSETGSLIRMEAVKANPNLSATADIKEFFPDRYWSFALESGNFSGSQVRLSTAGTETFKTSGEAGDLVVAESSVDGTIANLGSGNSDNNYVVSANPSSSKPKIFVLGKSTTVTVKVNPFITPNNLDDKNNALYIQNIEFYPQNTVTLIDRWGVQIKQWKNFKNYTSSDFNQTGEHAFDFSTLGVGNYVCILEYQDTKNNQTKKELQMISVIK